MRRLLCLAAVLLASTGPALADTDMIELATRSGCFICHSVSGETADSVPLAPPYTAIAERYRNRADAFDYLTNRVLHGTVYTEQNWRNRISMRFMPPNVNVGRTDAAALVNWILKLDPADAATDRFRRHESMLALATTSGCFACHRMAPSGDSRLMPLAPALQEIADHYRADPKAAATLYRSVTQGTRSKDKKWDNANMQFMPPNLGLAPDKARELVDWILQLD